MSVFLLLQCGGMVLAIEEGGKNEAGVAIVNGEIVPQQALEKGLSVYKKLNQEVTDSTKKLVLDQLIEKMLLKQFVKEQGIVVSANEIQAELEKVKFFFISCQKGSGVSLEKVLESRGSSILELREKIRNQVALSKYLGKSIKADDLKSYFDSHKDCFNGEEVRASHILIDTRDLKSEEELAKANEKIEKLKKEIDNGADFAELAKENSDCPSSENGGDLGFFERKGTMVAPFADAAFLLKVGEVSEPVKTQFGLHLIKVTERRGGEEVSFDDEEVQEEVENIYREEKTDLLLESLRKNAKIEILM
jgi:parvulin-like peptidyl-prolyl isomerase